MYAVKEIEEMKIQDEKDAVKFIVDCKDKQKLDFGTIAEKLRKQGYTSPRTGRPLSESTVSSAYYHLAPRFGIPTQVKQYKVNVVHQASDSEERKKLTLISSILESGEKPEHQVALIRMLIKSL